MFKKIDKVGDFFLLQKGREPFSEYWISKKENPAIEDLLSSEAKVFATLDEANEELYYILHELTEIHMLEN